MTDAEFDNTYNHFAEMIRIADQEGLVDMAAAYRVNLDTLIANKIAEEGDMFRDSAGVADFERGAVKHDSGKPRMDLLPLDVLERVAKVLELGATKYGDYNFAQGMDYSRLIASILRHLSDWQRGVDIDPESGESHLAHATCGLLFLQYYQLYDKGKDDRHKR